MRAAPAIPARPALRTGRRTAVRGALAASTAVLLAVGSLPLTATAATLAEGSLDTSFSTDGKTRFAAGTVADDQAAAVVPLADGRAYVVGTQDNGESDGIVVRLKADGTRDTTYAGTGRFSLSRAGFDIEFRTAAAGPNGTLVIGGFESDKVSGDRNFLIVRLTAAGALDSTFDFDGKVISDYSAGDVVADVVVGSDGTVTYLGDSRASGSVRTAVIRRLTPAGNPDPTFFGGLAIPGQAVTKAENLVRLGDGRYVVATTQTLAGGVRDAVLVAVTDDAKVDLSFGSSGSARTSIPQTQEDTFRALGVDRAGRLIAVGYHIDPGASVPTGSLLMARFDSQGAPDLTLNGAGWRIADLPGGDIATVVAAAVDGKGRPVAALLQNGATTSTWRLARLTTGGSADTSFSGDGIAAADVFAGGDEPFDLAIGRNGRIAVAGNHYGTGTTYMAVARYLGDRTPPKAGQMGPLTAYATSGVRTVSWSATDDNTGIASYAVRYRSASATSSTFGSYTTWKAATTARTATFEGANGRTYCFSSRGKDRAANVGPFGAQSCVTFPVDDRGLARAGAWTAQTGSNYYRSTVLRSTASGASLTFAGADYRELGLVVTTCDGCGTVKVFRGTTLLKTVSLQSATTVGRVVIPIDSSSTVRSGTITIRQASGGKPVLIDGLIVGLVRQV